MADETEVRMVSLNRSATFTVEMPERAVYALYIIGQFGIEALTKAVANHMSESEAKKHGEGLKDLVAIGGRCSAALSKLNDARAVIDGRKIAVEPDRSR
jgi:hypothetical protein